MIEVRDIENMIGQTALGDRAAFGDLYTATCAKLFGICLHILDSRQEAEEALQEVYVKIWHHADRYQVNGLSPMTWLITVARNQAIDRLRARRQQGSGLDEAEAVPDGRPGREAAATAASGRALIEACLETLEPQKAEAVRAAYLDGETYADLASRYAIPLNTIRTWLRRSLLTLRECLSG